MPSTHRSRHSRRCPRSRHRRQSQKRRSSHKRYYGGSIKHLKRPTMSSSESQSPTVTRDWITTKHIPRGGAVSSETETATEPSFDNPSSSSISSSSYSTESSMSTDPSDSSSSSTSSSVSTDSSTSSTSSLPSSSFQQHNPAVILYENEKPVLCTKKATNNDIGSFTMNEKQQDGGSIGYGNKHIGRLLAHEKKKKMKKW